jgi:hypothetical protein
LYRYAPGKFRWLEDELETTGKGAYLVALNTPQC